jgi:hypothetical protein
MCDFEVNQHYLEPININMMSQDSNSFLVFTLFGPKYKHFFSQFIE